MNALLSSGGMVVLAVSGISALAVSVPLLRGLAVCLRGWRATRFVPRAALERSLLQPSRERVEPLAVAMARVLAKSLRTGDSEDYPSDFVLDASRQYASNEFETNYARLISMYASLLPPIGLIGNAVGMLILLLSLHTSDGTLELGGLAVALSCSIFGLTAFAGLEAVKIRLYGRLLLSLEEVSALHRALEEKRACGS